jgi:hypothetical protein
MTQLRKIELETVTFEWEHNPEVPVPRQKIVGAGVLAICEAYNSGKDRFAVEVPPRCGKSDIIYAVSRELAFTQGTITVCVAPWRTLAEQLRDRKKFERHVKYYKPTAASKKFGLVCRELPASPVWFQSRDENDRQVFLFTTTIGKARNGREHLMNGFKMMTRQMSMARPILIIDESQLLRDDKPWGELVQEAISNGAFVVVMTGTAYRADNKECTGFRYEDVGDLETCQQSYIKETFIDKDGNKKGKKATATVNKQKKKLVPDYQVTWDEAWKAGALCKATAVFVDDDEVVLEEKNQFGDVIDSYKGKLSEVPAVACKKYLRQIVEQPSLIDKCCDLTVSRLDLAKKSWPNKRPQWIVMAGSDVGLLDGDENTTAVNRHAKTIQRSLERAAKEIGRHDLRIKVATMANQDSSPDNLAEFKAGMIDILVVKMMGVVGLDLETIVGCTMLSTLRDGPTWAQFVTRCLTVRSDGKQKIGCLILPSDHHSRVRWDGIKKQGGEATRSESNEIKEEIVTLQSTDHTASLGNAFVSHYKDTHGNHIPASPEFEKVVRWVRNNLDPDLQEDSIYQGWKRGIISVPPEAFEDCQENNEGEDNGVVMSDASDFSEKARKEIESIATKIANKRASYSDDKIKWIRVKREFYTKLKADAGVHPNIEISNVQDCVKLKSMLESARRVANV